MKGVRASEELTRTMNLLPHFSVPKQKLICLKGVTAKTHSQGDSQPLSSNQKTILTGTGTEKPVSEAEKKVDYKLAFLLSQYFSWKAGTAIRQWENTDSLGDTDGRSVFNQLQDKLLQDKAPRMILGLAGTESKGQREKKMSNSAFHSNNKPINLVVTHVWGYVLFSEARSYCVA